MSRFKDYLTEEKMTFDMALKVFDITASDIADKDKLKRRYRRLVMKYHPDKGGDIEKAKDVNNAYEILSKSKVTTTDSSDSTREDSKMKYRAAGVQIKNSLMSNFQPDIFINYFQELSGNKYFYEITGSWPLESQLKGKYTYPTMAGFDVEFFTKDRNSVFTFKVIANLNEVVFPKAELGVGDISYTVYTEAHGFHMNKKQKMSKSDWKFTRDHSFFRKPEQLFPTKKMKAIFSGKTSKRKFQKRDMITFLTKKLKADWDGEWARIPLGEDYTLVVFRSVIMRMGTWGINGIYLKHGRVAQPRYCSFMEEEQTTEIFEKIQKEAMKTKGDAKVKKTERLVAQAYDVYKKSKGI